MCLLTRQQQHTLRGKFVQLTSQNIELSNPVYKMYKFPILWICHILSSAMRASVESMRDQFLSQ